ncbi:SNF2 family N-terminal domain-domain-containing protein [Absidia repens]|uniref:SNF2 family N-terminal domain-domain-containing protein n=1 Tax=Absidia repens TaxID=90262 RepID=A0A1X2IE05_9FUNG|nr:SNF2 family N-terminal domain-domain-containing protein [Absidia repens]
MNENGASKETQINDETCPTLPAPNTKDPIIDANATMLNTNGIHQHPSSSSSSGSDPSSSSNSPITNAPKRKNDNGSGVRLTKRDKLIESKLKGIKVRSLFDTDGDINSHNILASDDGSPGRPKRQVQQKRKYSGDIDYGNRNSNSDCGYNGTKKKSRDNHSGIVDSSPSTASRKGRPPGSGKKRRDQTEIALTPPESTPTPPQAYPGKRRGRKPNNLIADSASIITRKSGNSVHQISSSGRPKKQQQKTPMTPIQSTEMLIQQRHKSVQLLRPSPKTPLEKARNDAIRNREHTLQTLLAHHDSLVRELAHLEVYQTIVDYRPDSFNTDERVTKYMLDYNMWNLANDHLLKKQRTDTTTSTVNSDRLSRRRNIQQQQQQQRQSQVLPLIQMLQHSSELDALSASTDGSFLAHLPNETQRHLLLRSLPPAAVNTIRSGTGVRKFNRQYPTLDAYLSTFISIDDNEEDTNSATTKDMVNKYVEKERAIRARIQQLENTGGFTTQLKELANRRPQQVGGTVSSTSSHGHQSRGDDMSMSVYGSIVSQAIIAAKNFHQHTKYRRNAARKCAKAVDKYWDQIRTRDERLQREEVKRLMRLAKWTVQQVRGKWKVVERICEARYKEIIKEQQAQKSRKHLEMILEHSEQMLGVRMDELSQQQQQISWPNTPQSSSSQQLTSQQSDTDDQEEEDDGWEDDNDDESATASLVTATSGNEDDDNYSLASLAEYGDTGDYASASAGDEGDDERLDDHFIDDADDIDSDESDGDQDENLTVEQLRLKYLGGFAEESQTEEEAKEETITQMPDLNGLDLLVSEDFKEGDTSASQDSDYSHTSTSSTYELNISDDSGETEDDDEVLYDLHTAADIPLDQLYAQYPPPPSPSSTHDSNNGGTDQPDNSNLIQVKSPQEAITPMIRKAVLALSDLDSDDDQSRKRMKLETEVDDLAQQLDSDPLATDLPTDDIVLTPDDMNPATNRRMVNDVVDEDDDRTVTDYGSEPPDDDDEIKSDDLYHSQQPGLPMATVAATTTTVTAAPTEVETQLTVQQEHGGVDQDQVEAQQPTGTTLSTTKVDTRIPSLLRGTLREYQHVGLDWLASLYNNGLNGILADEMGLGKTIQTIALLASLACDKGIWGPHLVVVPTSVILNWEMEFKRWLPGFKILTYYGNPKERKEKRMGWSKENAFHVCITSYQLVLQDQSAFRRKAWQYLILDEAHHIKNFRSQRWQVLLNFNSKRRLLLTGTPLQNNLMELWSLLYFLMPNGVSASMPMGFANLKEFQEWFSSPVDRMIENQQGLNEESRLAIQKLHTVLRPYLLRRLKVDVEQQMPAKYEHVMYCRLSKRQRYLYDDFMGRTKTKETLASGSFLSIINTLMQLRKVCNHPDLFEERPIVTSFSMNGDVIDRGHHLDTLIRRLCDTTNKGSLGTKDLEPLNMIILQPQLETSISQVISEEYSVLDCSSSFLNMIQQQQQAASSIQSRGIASVKKYLDLKTYAKVHSSQQQMAMAQRWQSIQMINQRRCQQRPLLGADLLDQCRLLFARPYLTKFFPTSNDHQTLQHWDRATTLSNDILSYQDRVRRDMDVIERYTFVTPAAVVSTSASSYTTVSSTPPSPLRPVADILHPITSRLQIAFPDKRLLQYDCGKLQRLAVLLQELAAGGHRALIFTQMTRVLDVLEAFLNMHGHRYLRLDGATKVEQRQLLTEQFNSDKRILCFILSTRSGGLGINLTGADTVIFYDSDWNPSMDKQCQDRAHRIGQLRDVHIYRFVTEYTIEENIFKKANQKRLLDDMVIQEGGFTNDYFQKMDWWKDLPEVTSAEQQQQQQQQQQRPVQDQDQDQQRGAMDLEQALLEAEGDEIDAQAAIVARNEMTMDDAEFDDDKPSSTTSTAVVTTSTRKHKGSPSPSPHGTSASPILHPSLRSSSSPHDLAFSTIPEDTSDALPIGNDNEQDDTMALDVEVGHVDQYMLRFWESEMFGNYLGFGGLPKPVDY